MSDPFVPRLGAVLSADIAVPEHEREVHFYARVLNTGDAPMWRQDLLNNRGMPIIGLGERGAQYADLPLQWMPHIQVADVGASAERALELGGSELMRSGEEAGTGQWAVLRDANGAAFGIIPVAAAEPASRKEGGTGDSAAGVGRIAWVDLTVPDAPGTRDFYRQVVGWSVQDVAMEDGAKRYADYSMLDEDGDPAAGICHSRGVNADLPPVWLIYLPVGDLAVSMRRVEEEGGRVLTRIGDGDGGFSGAVIQDPVGAYFALVQGH